MAVVSQVVQPLISLKTGTLPLGWSATWAGDLCSFASRCLYLATDHDDRMGWLDRKT